ncbi:hypothetical protein ASD64_13420 [Mesorhizobium sp. Root157]|uniref:terminase TerL endonuclease subunit n=1 Tax=Mesorhizobium sp. Root157 TaxID=1736477 RepID=UPI0006FE5CA0|nr:terminase TerL endonuclease subunit [Mesorhizobium sp. Root157]KQZ99821.1 hypothetical protein ASD64_13420 [Mesorhizobium sp. Root157]
MAVWEEGGLPANTDWRIVKHDLDELEQKLLGRECYGGLDLARVNDLSAFVLLFPPTLDEDLGALAGKWIVLCRFFIPEHDILRRVRRDRVPYDIWCDQGFLTATLGNATDFAFVEKEVIELASRYDLRVLPMTAPSPARSSSTYKKRARRWSPSVRVFLSVADPTAELERLSVSRSLWHGGHSVPRWNASNVAVRHDPAGNIKRDKERSSERLDGIVAICNAPGRASARDVNAGSSAYETRGLLML